MLQHLVNQPAQARRQHRLVEQMQVGQAR